MRGRSLIAIWAAILVALATPSALLAQEPRNPAGEPGALAQTKELVGGVAGEAQPPLADAEPSVPAADRPPEQAPSADQARTGETETTKKPASKQPQATAAGDVTVRMGDFYYTPKTITVSVGDTVTWVNDGPDAPHTATAEDDSFDTGIVDVGDSGSVTLKEAGTFPYICTLHPGQMDGTVEVNAASGSNGSGDSSGSKGGNGSGGDDDGGTGGTGTGSSGTGSSTTTLGGQGSSATGSSLPSTGFPLAALLFTGLALLGVGGWLEARRRA